MILAVEAIYIIGNTHYYGPMQKNPDILRRKYDGDKTDVEVVNMLQSDIDLISVSDDYSYVLYAKRRI